jgi:NitT/TauT family transport system ATP-binding protein
MTHGPVPSPQDSVAASTKPVKLRVTGVSKTFETAAQTVEVLQGVDVDIRAGEFVVLFGPSGCGKTTLLNMIAGFDKPTTGELLLDGEPIRGPGNDRLMMFQEHTLFPWLNVLDNVMYGLRWEAGYRFRRRKQHERALDLLRIVHLEEFAKSPVHELSGGMKQRVALARALAPDPQLLLIDEPFAALDALVRAKLYTELQEILVRTGKTIVAVTHDSREAACLGDRVLVFTGRPGRLRAEIPIDLPRPRDINDTQVTEYANRIAAQLEVADGKEDRPHA